MKKKNVLLVMLFCATLVMAIFGLGTEKAYAYDWNPGWGETGGNDSKGYATQQTFYCKDGYVQPNCTDMCGSCWGSGCRPVENLTPKQGTHCALVSTESCTPNNPC